MDARRKIFGLGYHLLLFVYDNTDDPTSQTVRLRFVSCAFIAKERTAGYPTTFRLREMVADGANAEDIAAYRWNTCVATDEATLNLLAEQVLKGVPEQGFLTTSNARLSVNSTENLVWQINSFA